MVHCKKPESKIKCLGVLVTFVYKKILRILSKNNVCESTFIKTEYIVLGDFLAISETSCYNETRYGKKHPEITDFSQGQKRFCLCFFAL